MTIFFRNYLEAKRAYKDILGGATDEDADLQKAIALSLQQETEQPRVRGAAASSDDTAKEAADVEEAKLRSLKDAPEVTVSCMAPLPISEFRSQYSEHATAATQEMLRRLEATFPDRNCQYINVRGDGRCLLHALNTSSGIRSGSEIVPSIKNFVKGTRHYFEWFRSNRTHRKQDPDIVVETPEQEDTVQVLSDSKSNEDLIRVWENILRTPQNLPISLLPVLQFVYKVHILQLTYDSGSPTPFTHTYFQGYQPPPFTSDDGIVLQDIAPTVILFNNNGHYYLIETPSADKSHILGTIETTWGIRAS